MTKPRISARTSIHIPRYGLLCCAAMLAAQLLCFCGTRLFLPHLTTHVMTGPLDARIPFSPPWVTVYFLSFLFWAVNGLWIVCQEKAHVYRFAAAYILAMLLSAAVFLLYPGTMARPEITGSGFFDQWMRLLYRIDSPTNLFPSLHVLVSYFCWRGTMGTKIPGWYRAFSFLFFLLVCCSVLLVKQHALADVPAGIFFAELSLQCARALRLERIPYSIEDHFRKE